ncbi:hypothetical protein D3218_19090 [Aureimonas flava]|uniref:Uncharacterized protein n=1 Tax=Aureimonas flava TaxID=2320271 RepID=A0A3A1WF90_9HYPH|nr:hypothetical protein D3218_19090 [Aureimonas flava]
MAPNLNFWLWRPILADPPLYSVGDLETWVTLTHVMDCHEALDLKEASLQKAQQAAELNSSRR